MARARRGRGEGGVYPRKGGGWAAEVSMGHAADGRRRRKTLYGATKAEVMRKLDDFRQTARAGTLPAAGAMTVGHLLDRWLEDTRPGLAARTAEERPDVVDRHVRPHLARVRLADLTKLHVAGLYSSLRAAKVGAATVRRAAVAPAITLNYAVELDLIRANPADARAVPKPKVPRREMVALTHARCRRRPAAARAQPVDPPLAVAFGGGCRQGDSPAGCSTAGRQRPHGRRNTEGAKHTERIDSRDHRGRRATPRRPPGPPSPPEVTEMTDKPAAPKPIEPKKRSRARRGRGEASIYRREEDGLWVGTVSLGYSGEGKRIRKVVYGGTKGEVQTKLDALRAEARAGNLPDAGALTVGQLLDRWLAADRQKTAARTQEERERVVKNHLKPRLGGVKLARLNALHVEGLYADMARDGKGAFTVRAAADLLSIALNHAVRLKLIRANPAAAVKKPKTPKREMVCLTDTQAKTVLVASEGVPVGPLVITALGTGCRQGELLALAWEDLDLRAGTLTVRRSLAQTQKGYILKEPKTAASRRTLTLPGFAVDALTALKADRTKAGLLDAPVFCTRTGGHLDKKNVLRAFRGVVAKANASARAAAEQAGQGHHPAGTAGRDDGVKLIPDKVRFHDLRHTVASLLLSKGHSLKAVSARLGHANPTMTLRVYTHTMPNDDANLADGLARMMG